MAASEKLHLSGQLSNFQQLLELVGQVPWLQIACIALATILSFFLVVGVYNAFFHPLKAFPGPKTWAASPFLKYLYAVQGQLDVKILALHERYGEVVRISPDELSFNSERAWHDIYSRRDAELPKDPLWYNCVEKKGQSVSILNAGRDDHARLRRNITPAFSEAAMRQQEPIVRGFVDYLIGHLDGLARSGEATDMVKWYNFIMFDLAGYLTIGRTFDCLKTATYHPWVSSIFKYIKVRVYVAAVIACTGSKRLVGLITPDAVREAQLLHENYVRQHGSERWAQGADVARRDLISYVFESLTKTKDERGSKEEKNEILGSCNFFMRAGSETVATALSGLTFYLLRTPHAMNRLTAEIRGAFNDHDEITFQSTAARLPYLTACLKETLRIYPPGPSVFPRRTLPGQPVDIAGHIVPGWTSVGVHNFASSRGSANFARPHDFCPERWLPASAETAEFASDVRGATQVFSMGSRNCIGKGLAFNEMRLIVAHLLWNFDLQLVDQRSDWADQQSFVIWQKTPLMCRVSPVAKAKTT